MAHCPECGRGQPAYLARLAELGDTEGAWTDVAEVEVPEEIAALARRVEEDYDRPIGEVLNACLTLDIEFVLP